MTDCFVKKKTTKNTGNSIGIQVMIEIFHVAVCEVYVLNRQINGVR